MGEGGEEGGKTQRKALICLALLGKSGDPLIGSPAHKQSTGLFMLPFLISVRKEISQPAGCDQRLLASELSQAF